MELREQLIKATIEEISRKNYKFRMDDLAKRMGISKKTIYTEFMNKEELLNETIDYFFNQIKSCEQDIINNKAMDVVDRLKRVIIVMPDGYKNHDYRQMAEIRDKFPKVYKKVAEHLVTGWEPTLELYRQAVKEGKLRKMSEVVFKLMVEGAMQEFLSSNALEENGISYEEALGQMIDIIFRGLEIN